MAGGAAARRGRGSVQPTCFRNPTTRHCQAFAFSRYTPCFRSSAVQCCNGQQAPTTVPTRGAITPPAAPGTHPPARLLQPTPWAAYPPLPTCTSSSCAAGLAAPAADGTLPSTTCGSANSNGRLRGGARQVQRHGVRCPTSSPCMLQVHEPWVVPLPPPFLPHTRTPPPRPRHLTPISCPPPPSDGPRRPRPAAPCAAQRVGVGVDVPAPPAPAAACTARA